MGVTIIHSVLLFDGTTTRENATVVFDSESGTIISVDRTPASQSSPEAVVIDGTGCTLLPGFIDSHIHCDEISLPPGADSTDILRAPLRCGITTVCDMHSDPATVKRWRSKLADETSRAAKIGGTVSMSDLKSALHGATISNGYPKSLLLGTDPPDQVGKFRFSVERANQRRSSEPVLMPGQV
jgi:dihydroorotase-like cyclic amidohydrolase